MTQRLTLQDQVLVNLCGWVAAKVYPNENLPAVIAGIAEILPHVTRTNPEIHRIATAAADLVAVSPEGAAWAYARLDLCQAIQPLFMMRAGLALNAIEAQKEPAHATT